ncbi:Transposable element Tcb1 transposase [Araneus ventricosus]|uniref:Transposable element Tcb1 transposase n=1 Tax=Araneus ventricosus TaxID=182803 RepID=A0A4Y2SCH7_ARAVE|nr:Transposable element Tcb1 transposase [Araneus ventricosus]
MFSWSTLGSLISVDTSLNSTDYLNIVTNHVHSFMAIMFPYGVGPFKQDNAPCHHAQSVSNWFEENQAEFNLLPWPAQSSDLNPKENLWDEVEKSLRNLETPPSNLTQLRAGIMSAWVKIPQQRYQKIVESMPRKILAVIRS